MNTIFIQIASYRDPELIPTLKDLLEKAENPNNFKICIAWQHAKEDEWDILDEYKDDVRFKIIDLDYTQSKGACWARNLLQQEYNGEKYTLQLDSHTRFVQNWDSILIDELEKLREKGHKKPMLTGYIPSYEPSNDPEGRVNVPWKMDFDRFSPDGNVHFLPASIDGYKKLDSPLPARFYSAHFCFTDGIFVKEVPHDPEYYFHGEEISISVRSFTWGYDLFHLHKVVMWHYYTRKGLKKHWDDDKKWGIKNSKSHSKNRKLFSMDDEVYNSEEFGIYGFGNESTLVEYERYSGISFSNRAIQQYTKDRKAPPNPTYDVIEDYENSFLKFFKHCIDINFDAFNEEEYDFWAVIFEDEQGKELYRQDADKDEIEKLKQDPDRFYRIWRSFTTKVEPYKWVVWAHSKDKEWCERIEGKL